ncbi:protein CHROMATIN REMODELING 24 [Ananas comosus]|uniref:Protein CHROMATIN REMODELING 24 n=1 Tax=Ananas comosus TaxID=4615 RepID=A0A6P5F5D7_ANACO|nr:protein CHROMATIN REMODELING 24 [Ananas comosus]
MAKPLSLNERNDRLLHHLSRSRPRNPNPNPQPRAEVRVRKVKLEGRRRLCKLSAAADDDDEVADGGNWLDSPPTVKEGGGSGGGGGCDSIRDILDDLSSRLELLSVEKPKPKPKPKQEPAPHKSEPEVEYRSATSSLSDPSPSLSSPDEVKETKNCGEEVKGKAPKRLVLDVDEEDEEEKEEESVASKSSWNEESEVLDDENEGALSDAQDEDGEDFTMAGTGVSKSRVYKLPDKIVKKLYPHQRDGLKWLWSLHCKATGGILGDDMGLGKTMQICAFLVGLFHSLLIRRALVVAPKTLLVHWMKELSVVGLGEKIRDYSGTNANARNYELQYTLKEGGILLTTYDIVRNNYKAIRGSLYANADDTDEEIIWDYVILDEGHIIKNPKTQRAKSLVEIPSDHRIVISGTPIQNNLKELWALFNFCCPEVLGDKDEFKIRYENAILRGNDKNASDREKHIGSTVAKELRERIKPYFLRRLKSEVFLEDDSAKTAKLAKKNEIIVWLKLTPCQRQLYEAFLNSELVHSSIHGSLLAAITILKKICDHPMLLTKKAAEGVLEGMDSMLNDRDMGMVERMAMSLAEMTDDNDLQVDRNVSCKISFILSLLKNLIEEGHIVLIFSQTRKMLNIIQEAIQEEGYNFLRIDGTTKVSDREKIVKDFQEGIGAPIFLLTSQVGGLGLTLTKADRVIVVDPAWNPSTDNQSVDRAYRIGQTKDVLVYRLMTSGTIEEKIYKMQVFKGGLFRTATEHKEQTRYFSKKDIQELFRLPEQGFDVSVTQKQLQEEHDKQHNMSDSLRNHIKFLEQQGIAGVSHHSLLFSKTAVVPLVHEDNEIQSKVKDRIIRSSMWHSSSEHVAHGAQYAFNPKDPKFTSRTYSSRTFTDEVRDSPEDIEGKIKRLSHTLTNKDLIAKLPDHGDKIRRQILELELQLHSVVESTHDHSPKTKEKAVICIDDIASEFEQILSV